MKKIIILTLSLFTYNAVNAQHYKVIKTFPIQSDGRWDYIAVSPVSNNIYVSHATQVNVLDKTTGDSVTVFEGTTGVHGIVFAKEFNKGFISNGILNNLFVFDATTNKIIDSIPTGKKPDAMCYDPFSKRLIVGNGKSKNATIIDAATNKVLATIPLNGKPEASVSDEKGKVFINIEDRNEIAVIDIKALKLIKRYNLKDGEEPAGLAIDNKKHVLFSTCGNQKMFIIDANTGKEISVLPIGAHCDGAAFDSKSGNAFASNGDGTLTVVHQNKAGKYEVVENAISKQSARTIAVDPKTGLVYLPAAEFAPQTNPQERPEMKQGSFQVLVMGK